ncbi:NAD-dependent succinate-semialdehyde dehydrogenase [Gallaecimonas kandeliae]|uniref:NAD-dependent succinate-semialdehyde dehydrogenase n=1 Tax=Gallaecimonas kandeliae TaxID=3029055 RepID=UPI002647C5C3|nr:NAD-dependent succinate-semialdehyde dehydrogenase [Gallaecimonas kandeliae]WKE65275.1 NAD-dependent succinate-semialdehyde dehydrogenase [Gallaecimonas kandeliae]
MQLRDPELFRTQAFIDGRWQQGGGTFAITNPADGAELAQVADITPAQVEAAIQAAHAAFPAWRALTAKERSQLLRRWFELIMANQADLALLMSQEQGKPLVEAKGEIAYAASFVEWFAEEAKRAYGDIIPAPKAGQQLLVLREPVGVVAAITPWNFPAAMITRKLAPALAAGCTAIVKPAAETPLTALALAELARRAGIPAGVLNVVTGLDAAALGQVLTASPLVRKLSFTGSTAVGALLMGQCSHDIKKLSLELGGNAPFIVFADADLDAAVEGAMAAKFRNAGQTCVCANRFYVQRPVLEPFLDKLVKAMAGLKVGAGTEPGVTTGPLISAKAVQKVEAHISDALAGGARLLLGGKRHKKGGTFFEPTLLADLAPDALIAREETFGPVAAVLAFDEEEEAIRLANATPFGLAAYFYSQDLGRVFRVAQALESGMVGVNTGLVSNEVAPFGGVKSSGLGREGSKYGLDEYLEMKYLCIAGLGA